MSIHRSGLVNEVFVVCVEPLNDGAVQFEVGKKYPLVLDMGAMFVVKAPDGQDAVVPKEKFVVAKE